MDKRQQQFSLVYLAITFFALVALQSLLAQGRIHEMSYSEFKAALAEGWVTDLVVTPTVIRGTMKNTAAAAAGQSAGPRAPGQPTKGEGAGKTFTVVRVEDPDLVKELEARKVAFKGTIESTWLRDIFVMWVLPIGIFMLLGRVLYKKVGPGADVLSLGRNKAKIYAQSAVGVTFDDVAGVDEAKEELREVVEFLKSPDRFTNLGGRIPKGVLLVGPPGTGKTLLAKAVAGEAGVPFFSVSGSEFVEMFVGLGAARVRDLFAQAAGKAPCIIFIDELDALAKARGANPLMGGHDEREQTLNQLLVEMDGFDTRKGVIILAATNRPEILDPALLRPGRFDRQVLVDRPDIKGREAILRVHARTVKLDPSVDLKVLAARTPGFVGADLANILNEAALLAARRRKAAVGMAELEEAIDRVVAGLEKKAKVMSPKEREIVAHHEAGHALVAELVPTADRVHKVSIIPRGIAALGYTLQLPTEDRYLLTQEELLDRLAVLLGGRVAEEITFKEVSTGGQNDLQRATDIARRMVKEYGMSEALGPLTYEPERTALFLPGAPSLRGQREYGEETAQTIDREVRRIVDEAHQRVRTLLTQQNGKLEALAKVLLEREVLEGDELRRVLAAA